MGPVQLFRTTHAVHKPRLPGSIRFAERADSYDQGVEIRFKDRTLNAEMPPDGFTIAPPAGTKVIDVGCGPAPG